MPLKLGTAKLYYPTWVAILIVCTIMLCYASVHGIQFVYRQVFPDVTVLKTNYPVALGKQGSHIVYRFQPKRPAKWVSLKQVSRHAVAAILMSEDASFFQHHGYDPDAIRDAIEHNSKPGVKIKRGGSTITQQVVKNLFLSPEKTLTRKARELLLSVEIERKFSKRKILETYINIAEWGPGVYGIEQASQKYFHKSSAELTAHDAAVLAFMLPNPTKYQNSIKGGELSPFAQRRVEAILERMWKTGKISDEEYTSSEQSEEIPSSL